MDSNQIKMREALVQCELFLGNVSRHGHPTLCPGDKCTACDGVDELRGMVVSALSTSSHKGKWKNGTMYEYEYAYCSECGRIQWTGWDLHKQAEEEIGTFACNYRYCPGCGVEMDGGVYVK